MTDGFRVLVLLIYIAATAFLENEEGGRLVPADILLVGISALAFVSSFLRGKLYFSTIHLYALPMMAVFLVGAILAKNPGKAAFELLVIMFCFIGSVAIIDLLIRLPELWIKRFFNGYLLVLGMLAAICLIDFLLLPGLVSSRALGGLQGPFRNTGQAGSFFGVHAAVCIALLLSGVVPRITIYFGCALAVVLALLFTFKRAASAGFVIGIVILTIQLLFSSSKQDKKIGFYFAAASSIALTLGSALFLWALENVSSMKWRFETKYSSEVVNGISDSFLADNIRNAWLAFSDSPIYGVGLNGVTGVYQEHEIHSTYFAIIAYSGVLGVFSYGLFMYCLTKKLWGSVKNRADNCYSLFLVYLFPMFLGLLVSWGYTMHWRKREFWLFLIFVVVCSVLSRRWKGNQLALNGTEH